MKEQSTHLFHRDGFKTTSHRFTSKIHKKHGNSMGSKFMDSDYNKHHNSIITNKK